MLKEFGRKLVLIPLELSAVLRHTEPALERAYYSPPVIPPGLKNRFVGGGVNLLTPRNGSLGLPTVLSNM